MNISEKEMRKLLDHNMRAELLELTVLNPAEYNPRKDLTPDDAEYQDIAKSLEDNGYVDPIVVNYDYTIIKGHQRRKVMMDLGYTHAFCIILDIKDKLKEKEANIALNNIDGVWDKEKLYEILVELDLNNIDLTATGFNKSDIELLQAEIQELNIAESAEDDDFNSDEEYENIETPVTKRGDIWICGNHRIMCGDSTDPLDIEKLMDGQKADLLITDPPYNVNYGDKAEYLEEYIGKGHRNTSSIKNDNMDSISFYHFLFDALYQGYTALREGAAIYVFHSENEGINFRKAFTDAGFKQAQCLIWEKNTFVLGRQDYQWRHEPILYGWKEGAAHYFIDDRCQDTVILDDDIEFDKMSKQELLAFIEEQKRKYKNTTSVIFENKPTRNDEHPTMKPVALVGKLIHNSSRYGWKVLDLFGGSGSTMIAAQQLERKAYIMELDEKFVDVEVKRYIRYMGEDTEVYKISPDGEKVKYNSL